MTRLLAVARWALLATMVLGLVGGAVLGRSFLATDVVVLALVAYAAVGAIITRSRPENALGWIFLTIGALAGLASASAAVVEGIDSDSPSPLELLAVWFEHWYWFTETLLATTFTVLLFPEGLPSRRWRPVLQVAIGSSLAAVVLTMFQPSLMVGDTLVDNPMAPFPATSETTMDSEPLFTALLVVALLCGLAAAVSIVFRFRRSRGVERAQLRWFALAVSLAAVAACSPRSPTLVPMTLFAACLGAIPVACGIAITRHGLYEIDRIVSRTVSYAIVTGVVLTTYALVVVTVSWLLPGSSALATAGATLAAVAVIGPALGRVQHRVDRRFNRARFDAAREVDAFAGRLRNSVDTTTTVADLEATVGRTLAPGAIGLWAPPAGGRP